MQRTNTQRGMIPSLLALCAAAGSASAQPTIYRVSDIEVPGTARGAGDVPDPTAFYRPPVQIAKSLGTRIAFTAGEPLTAATFFWDKPVDIVPGIPVQVPALPSTACDLDTSVLPRVLLGAVSSDGVYVGGAFSQGNLNPWGLFNSAFVYDTGSAFLTSYRTLPSGSGMNRSRGSVMGFGAQPLTEVLTLDLQESPDCLGGLIINSPNTFSKLGAATVHSHLVAPQIPCEIDTSAQALARVLSPDAMLVGGEASVGCLLAPDPAFLTRRPVYWNLASQTSPLYAEFLPLPNAQCNTVPEGFSSGRILGAGGTDGRDLVGVQDLISGPIATQALLFEPDNSPTACNGYRVIALDPTNQPDVGSSGNEWKAFDVSTTWIGGSESLRVENATLNRAVVWNRVDTASTAPVACVLDEMLQSAVLKQTSPAPAFPLQLVYAISDVSPGLRGPRYMAGLDSGNRVWFLDLLGTCPSDLNGDTFVDQSDFALFVGAFDNFSCAPCSVCQADMNLDRQVDSDDFIVFVAAYNEFVCP